jgi:chromosome segregation ATPase
LIESDGVDAMEAVLERLVALEMKVREALAELEEARRARDKSEEKIRTLEVHLRSREQECAALVAQRERDAAVLARMRSERDEVRGRVEGLLGEIARLEAAVQAPGA